ncbi:PREDICTED: uncharacterized protein LOC109165257 [Ipomoea nil]|uniref:uncharacterized protein LOC109165257 n=1 Tax=Ipomoea nil TaxID=35883 RepID=UPI000900C70B|nr:PREDICTED: uncharacterized protein LOC109165257 [Ipomoea nil]
MWIARGKLGGSTTRIRIHVLNYVHRIRPTFIQTAPTVLFQPSPSVSELSALPAPINYCVLLPQIDSPTTQNLCFTVLRIKIKAFMAPTAAMLLLNHHSRQSHHHHHHHSSSPPNVTVAQVKASVEKWVSNLNGILHLQQRSDAPEKQPTPDRKMESAGKANSKMESQETMGFWL